MILVADTKPVWDMLLKEGKSSDSHAWWAWIRHKIEGSWRLNSIELLVDDVVSKELNCLLFWIYTILRAELLAVEGTVDKIQDIVDADELYPVWLNVIQEITKVKNSCRFDQDFMYQVKNYLLSLIFIAKTTFVQSLQKFFDDRMSTFCLLSNKDFE